jgi:TPR repeat protein
VPAAVQAKPDATRAEETVDSAWREGRNAEAISLLSVASNRFPNAPARLETMVQETTADLQGPPTPELRAALNDAAEAGSPTAMLRIANAIAKDHPYRAAFWYEKAAGLGNAAAMTRLGMLCAKGIGHDPPNAARAIPWFERASAAGDAEAQFALADCYLRGLGGLEPDPQKAIELLTSAADRDYPRALDLLGTVYSQGAVVTRDYHRAYGYYRRAVDLNYFPSMPNLGVLLLNGHGPSGGPDAPGAMQLFERGANAGNEISMLYLAMALDGGHAGTPDPEKARMWYIAAAKAGNEKARQWCKDQKIEGF